MSTAQDSFRCHCGAEYSRIENFKRHQRKHTAKDYLKCSICFKSFTRPDVLKRHMAVHGDTATVDRSDRIEKSESVGTDSPIGVATGLDPPIDHQYPLQPDMVPLTAFPTVIPFPQESMPSGSSSMPLRSDPFDWSQYQDAGQAVPSIYDGLDWDNALQQILQEAGFSSHTIWPDASPQGGEFDFMRYHDVATGRFEHNIAVSRANSPPNDVNEEDKWPTNHRPKQLRPFVLGSGEVLEEIHQDPALDPTFAKYQQFWLSQSLYDRLKANLAIAERMPGPSLRDFRMPESLFTVNTLISLYLEHFYPQQPILHLPTFDVSTAHPLLLAGFICLGAGFSGLKGSRAFTVDLIDVMRRSVLVLLEVDLSNMRDPDLINIALIITVAGLLSGHQRTFELSEVLRGTLIHMCRRADLLEGGNQDMSRLDDADDRWRQWAEIESRKRLGLSCFIVDMMFPEFFDTSAYLSQGLMLTTLLPCDDRYWQAPTAMAWQSMLGVAPIPPSPYFAAGIGALLTPKYHQPSTRPLEELNSFASLCLINALHQHIHEFQEQLAQFRSTGLVVPSYQPKGKSPAEVFVAQGNNDGFEGRKAWLQDALDIWGSSYYSRRNVNSSDPLRKSARVLYHLGNISLRVDMRKLFAAAGKYGPRAAEQSQPTLRQWAISEEADIVIDHALQLLHELSFPRQTEVLHGPPAAFTAILCLWTCAIADVGRADVVLERFSTLVAEGERDGVKTASGMLSVGARYLARSGAWRIGAAYALVLTKLKI